MKKKILCGVLAMLVAFAMCACSAKVDSDDWFGVYKNEGGYVELKNATEKTVSYTFVMHGGYYTEGVADLDGDTAASSELSIKMSDEIILTVTALDENYTEYEGVYEWTDEDMPTPQDLMPEPEETEEPEPTPEPMPEPLISATDDLDQNIILLQEDGIADVQFFFPSTLYEVTPREDEAYAYFKDNTGTEPDMELTLFADLAADSIAQEEVENLELLQEFMTSTNTDLINHFYPDSEISADTVMDDTDFSLITYFTITNTMSDAPESADGSAVVYKGICKSMLREAQGGIFVAGGIAVARENRLAEHEALVGAILAAVEFQSKEEPTPEPAPESNSEEEDTLPPNYYDEESDYHTWSDPGDGDDAWSDPGDYGDYGDWEDDYDDWSDPGDYGDWSDSGDYSDWA